MKKETLSEKIQMNQEKKELFIELLLKWYKKNKRSFFWRENELTPFQFLIAELMLQKTNANQVEKIFPGFIKKYPDPESVNRLSQDELAEILQPLGLFNRRARDLLKTVKYILEQEGKIPETRKELMKLPGVGEYIANAIRCFAFHEPVPIIDANVGRVIKRVFSFPVKEAPSRDRKLNEFMEDLLPKEKYKDFNLALLDFAALTCTPKSPHCKECPLVEICGHVKNLMVK
ncbi:MAG: hypothetical protein ACTSYC_05585 [Promethearchaeota archaeon]